MFNRWIHICQAIDFEAGTTENIVNGLNMDETVSKKYFNGSKPVGKMASMKDNFLIGLVGEGGAWHGMYKSLNV